MRALLLSVLLLGCAPGRALTHEVRPAYLEVAQTGVTSYRILWKRPTMGEVAVHLVPHLSNGWLEQPPSAQYVASGFLVQTWTLETRDADPLAGRSVSIEGLEDTITDVLVRVRTLDGRSLETLMGPETPRVPISFARGASMSLPSFLLLGIEHILTGPDHLLFVLALILIVPNSWMLLKTVSAFTVAHSLTLAAATLGALSFPAPLLDALIALSIVFAGREAARARRGGSSLMSGYPWAVAFAFGLLHGLGFASGLGALALTRSTLLGALVLFNLGVEIGQLAFIVLILALRRACRAMQLRWPTPLAAAPAYAVGVLGAFWTLRYAAVLAGAS